MIVAQTIAQELRKHIPNLRTIEEDESLLVKLWSDLHHPPKRVTLALQLNDTIILLEDDQEIAWVIPITSPQTLTPYRYANPKFPNNLIEYLKNV